MTDNIIYLKQNQGVKIWKHRSLQMLIEASFCMWSIAIQKEQNLPKVMITIELKEKTSLYFETTWCF